MESPKCSFQNQEGIKFCGKCGYEINNNYKLEKEKRNAKSERKHVTIFFTDLSGYTAMTERLDPEDVRIILNHVFKKISEIIE
ncbi:MAG: hypothetical protein KAJ25_07430, partial [Desulfobacula sp.]|nr:hypothetical protein [Desulfobacula sp.]